VPVEFVVGTAQIESTPPGAIVYATNGDRIGETPLELSDMPPQVVRFRLSLAGYEPEEGIVQIVADATNSYRTNLLSTGYVSAMLDARRHQASSNYVAALRDADQALSFRAGDGAAEALRKLASGKVEEERRLGEAEAERRAQLTRPRETFDLVCGKNADANLFAEHELKTVRPAKEAEAAIVKSLQASPMPFKVSYEGLQAKDTYQLFALQEFSLGILGGYQRAVLLVVGKTTEGETQILYKVLEYQVQHTIVANGLAFHDEKKITPVPQGAARGNALLAAELDGGAKLVEDKVRAALQQGQ
jgi:hypothetical protein